MSSTPDLSRRDLLKVLGSGAAVVAVMGVAGTRLDADEAPVARKAPPPQPFTLPDLPYGFDGLEPVIDARTMELHYTKHHQAYIDAANRALAPFPALQKYTGEQLLRSLRTLPQQIQTTVRNQVGGHVNHCLYWSQLSPHPAAEPGTDLKKAIEAGFGSLDAFRLRMVDLGMKCFGSGWAWLSVGAKGQLIVHITANQDSPLVEGLTPILGIDVWEHAYYLKHQYRRHDYLQTIWRVIDWGRVSKLYGDAMDALPS